MKITPVSIRTTSLLTQNPHLEHLHTFQDFPVFMGCVDQGSETDAVADMVWDICTDTGIIQLRNLLPLDTLYLNQHNDGTGQVWEDHYHAFAKFLSTFSPGRVLEIGGAHDKIANHIFSLHGETGWTTIEPNPQYITNPKITVIKDWFNENFTSHTHFDTIVHSHVFEHTYDPVTFINHIAQFMQPGDKHIFTFPHLQAMLENKWTNCLNFEHTAFLTEDITDHILDQAGFKIIKKEYYGNPHSIFYATEKVSPKTSAPFKNHYEQYKKTFLDFVNFHLEMVKDLNEKIEASTGPVYLFGAHIFSQYLIAFGLKTDKIVSILDNSPIKIGKRLYGTHLMVESPTVLASQDHPVVILKVAAYRDEITKQIETINPDTATW